MFTITEKQMSLILEEIKVQSLHFSSQVLQIELYKTHYQNIYVIWYITTIYNTNWTDYAKKASIMAINRHYKNVQKIEYGLKII